MTSLSKIRLVVTLMTFAAACDAFGDCAKAKIAGGNCKEAQVTFDLSECKEESPAAVPATCRGEKAYAEHASAKGKYRATFVPEKGGWGEVSWKLEAVSFRAKVVAKAKQEAPAAREIASPHIVQLPPKETEQPAGEPSPGDGRLLGNVGTLRKSLKNAGLAISPNYSGEFSKVLSGGIEQKSTYMGKFSLIADEDLSAIGWTGGSAHVTLMGTHGTGPLAYVGDAQATSNIDTLSTARIYDAWIQQTFWENVSALVGLYDYNSEFYITPTSLVFLNSSLGVGKEVSQAAVNGVNSPSIFPIPSFGGRLKIDPNNHFSFMLAVMDGVAGDPENPYGTHLQFNQTDGLFVAAEASYNRGKEKDESPAKYGVGFWTYTQGIDSILPVNGAPEKRTSTGFYLLADQTIVNNLSVFARFGVASKDVNQFRYNLAGGIVYNHLWSLWDNDQIGFAVTSVANGSDFETAANDAGTPVDHAETTYEFLYRFEVVPGFAIQPDFQYVVNPSTDPSLNDAFVFALRFDILL